MKREELLALIRDMTVENAALEQKVEQLMAQQEQEEAARASAAADADLSSRVQTLEQNMDSLRQNVEKILAVMESTHGTKE
ncbi:MAG: hypothetical protein Q4B09_09770 [Lachnospiraceae bacterium]|nr:hypothetical protein [Lachnospiraceae bacterium]